MSDEVNFEQLWEEAVDRYMGTTNRTPEDKKLLLGLHNIDDLFNQIEKESTKFSAFRNKRARFRNVLTKSVKPFIALSDIAQSALSLTPFAPASTVFGAVVFLVQAAGGVSESYDWIEELFEKLRGFTERLEQYVDGSMNEHLRTKVIAILTCLLEILARAETVMKSGRFKKYAAVLFLGQDDEVKASFDRLGKLFEDEHALVHAISYATTQRIEQKTDDIGNTTKQTLDATEDIQKKLDDLSTTTKSAEVKALLNDNLLTPAYQKNVIIYNEYAESTIEKTGDWLLEDSNVKRWNEKQPPLLWVFGGPGTGKSCLSSKLIRYLRDKYPQDPKHPNRTSVAYFFTREDDPLKDPLDLLKTLAYQIAQNDKIFRVFAANVLSKPDSVATPRLLWKNLFLNFYKQDRSLSNEVVIVLDGLDEAPRSLLKELFSLLEDMSGQNLEGRLSFALFSRPELSEFLEPKFSRIMVKVEVGNRNEGDIAQYIKKRLSDILVVKQTKQLRDKKAAAKLARAIREKVLDKADGMFFKVVLIMDQIQDKERKHVVFEAIEEAPPQLDAMIAHVFEKLTLNEDVDKGDLNELLLWVAFAKSEITINQLYAIMKVRTGEAYDALEARLRGKFASIFKLSGSSKLKDPGGSQSDSIADLKVTEKVDEIEDDDDFDIDQISDEEAGDDGADDRSERGFDEKLETIQEISKDTLKRWRETRVRFTHASIRDFLVQSRIFNLDAHTGSVPVYIDPRLADLHMADICMKRIIEFGTNYIDRVEKPDFIGYSCRAWIEHLKSADKLGLTGSEKVEVVKTFVNLFTDPVALNGLVRGMGNYHYYGTMLHFIKNPTFASMIRNHWFTVANQEDYSSEQWEWIQKSKESNKELFRPLAKTAARLWLERSGPDDLLFESQHSVRFFLWILWAWIGLDDTGSRGVESLNLSRLFSYKDPEFDEAIYEKLCDSFDFEKTQYWYCAHGWLMYNSDQPTRSAELFIKALEIDPNCWYAHAGLGWCWQEENFDDAKKSLEKAMENIPKSLKVMRLRLKSNVMAWMLERDDDEAVAKWAGESYDPVPKELNSGEFAMVMTYILALFALKRYDRLHEILVDISRLPMGIAMPEFMGLCCALQQEIGIPLWLHGDAVQVMQPCIDEFLASKQHMETFPWGTVWFAQFMYSFYPTSDAAQELLERIAARSFSDNLGEEVRAKFEESRGIIEELLACIYAEKARQAHADGSEPKVFVDKLHAMAIADESSDTYKINSASLLLACYWREMGEEEKNWKACLRPTMLEGIDMLRDDDPGNDLEAYYYLTKALIAAGDFDNAIAANVPYGLGLTYPLAIDRILGKGFPSFNYSCDGICSIRSFHQSSTSGNSQNDSKEVWYCTSCYDTTFCEVCIEQVKKGELPWRKCNKDHQFLKVLPVSEELKERAAAWNAEKEELEVNAGWLEGLKSDWLE
ncbi:hypothetical protein N0V90_003715 [Kalmusia sp. IMI 367209]|nr:hypothetical protein N0V90_003715 [Kalmusia sp. IMI 367209]